MNSYVIIMAGGVGTRFWPHGSAKLPKQFLPIADSALTMLQMTAKRSRRIAPPEKTLVITNRQYVDEVKNQLPDIPERNIIGEPVGKNTAPCIGLAAFILKQFDEHSGMLVIPADHLIEDETRFENVVKAGLSFVEKNDAIVTLGIAPTHPETGYGYIQYIDEQPAKSPFVKAESQPGEILIYKVKTFAEKPTLETAKSFLESGDFLWNSGIFIFRTEVILQEIMKLLPKMYKSLASLEQYMGGPQFHDLLEKAYDEIKSISIDYGVMEKTKQAYVIKTDFSWSDVGSWDEVYRIKTKDKEKNVIIADSFVKDSTGNLLISSDAFVGLIGVKDLIVINTRDGLLICKRGRSQEVKELVDYLKRRGIMEG